MTLPQDPDEAPINPRTFVATLVRSAMWLVGSGFFLFMVAQLARHSERRFGVLSIGFASVFFAWAAGRPPFVTGLRFHPSIQKFGERRKGDFIGTRYVIVLGLIFLAMGVYQLLIKQWP